MLEQEFYDQLIKNQELQLQTRRQFVYYNNIKHNRIEALIDIFPAITACLSNEYIRHICQDFVTQYDPEDGNLNIYGRYFGQYLASLDACKPYPYVHDLADFEYHIRRLLYAPDQEILSPDAFAANIQNQQSPRLIQASFGFNCSYPVSAIADYALRRQSQAPDISQGEYYYFLYRDLQTLNIFVKQLSKHSFEIIPILSIQGINGLNDTLLANPEITEFIQFLIINNLWTLDHV